MNQERTSTAGQVMGIIGIVLGVISLIVAFIPCVGVVAFIPGILALIFGIVSIAQASSDNGSKGLGIGALIISIIAIIVAALWLMIFSGASVIADKFINNSDQFEKIGKEFENAFDEEMDKNFDMNTVSDSLEQALKELESEMDKMEGTIDEQDARDAGKATAKAIKKAAEGLRTNTDSTKD